MSRPFGKTLDNANEITADDVFAGTVTADTITAQDVQTTTEEATLITTDHLITTGPLGVDVSSGFGDLTMTMDPSTTYGTVRSSSTAFGISLEAQGAGKFIKLGTNGNVRIGIQDTKTTIFGDLYVTGTIYNVPSGYTFFTPTIASITGGLGTIVYSIQQGVYSISEGGTILYNLEVAGTYSGSSSTQLTLNALPVSDASTIYGSNSMISSLASPAGGNVGGASTADTLVNYVTGVFSPMSGSATFDIITSGFYISGSSSTFTPALTAGASVFTYSTQTGYYDLIGGVYVFYINIAATYTGASGSTVVLSTLPATNGSIPVICGSVQNSIGGTGIQQPSVLRIAAADNTGTFFNSATNTSVSLSGAGSLNVVVTGFIAPNAGLVSFTPAIIPQIGTWVETGKTVTAKWSTTDNVVFFFINYNATVTSTSTEIRLAGLPLVLLANCVVSDCIITGLGLPIALRGVAGTNSMAFYNSATQTKTNVSIVSQPVTMQITGYYLTQ